MSITCIFFYTYTQAVCCAKPVLGRERLVTFVVKIDRLADGLGKDEKEQGKRLRGYPVRGFS